eukprot:COSAG06_NODE_48030_length_335_cov_0.652542_1_plen_50_part_10
MALLTSCVDDLDEGGRAEAVMAVARQLLREADVQLVFSQGPLCDTSKEVS